MKSYTFDVGGTGTKCIVFENKKEIKNEYLTCEADVVTEFFTKTRLVKVFEEISKVLDNEKEEFNVFLALPGIIDSKNKKILSPSTITEIDINIEEYFSKYKNMKKILIENDAKSAAIGEFYERNKTKKVSNMVHITIGTAIGGGIIINGKIYNGANLRAGEFGKMYSSIGNERNYSVTFDTGLGALLFKRKFLNKEEKILTGKQMFELYNEGEEIAVKMIDEWIEQIAKLIINLDYVLDFELITIGGGVSENEQFQDMIKKAISKNKEFVFQGMVMNINQEIESKFDISMLKNKAACYGGLYLLNK
ncbi:ROK family protein [Spiroplasma monobiae]|uniref:Glucokinase n=1 Tax=Spiroplasma monobiae MQ-1 TaxID=1336748 RepID=A0A2K9LUL7_SPISQ|nr:ROK family protein [Spiroplasma monobiae]AUM62720.1 hypothetical protein SMONO_v1c04710 [Spiroplasma monobiae MQ-1]